MTDSTSRNNYHLFLTPLGDSQVELKAYNRDAFRERVDFVGQKPLDVVLYELEHPLGLADDQLQTLSGQLQAGESVEFDVVATRRQMQECGYIIPVDYVH